MPDAFVITHPVWGVFLGAYGGLGFWSKRDTMAGQEAAVVFPCERTAEAYMARWGNGRPPEAVLHPVRADLGTHASVAACVAAGLESWLKEWVPTRPGAH